MGADTGLGLWMHPFIPLVCIPLSLFSPVCTWPGGRAHQDGSGAGGLYAGQDIISLLYSFVSSSLPSLPAAGLEGELIRMAVELEASMLAKMSPETASKAMPWRRSEEDRQVRGLVI